MAKSKPITRKNVAKTAQFSLLKKKKRAAVRKQKTVRVRKKHAVIFDAQQKTFDHVRSFITLFAEVGLNTLVLFYQVARREYLKLFRLLLTTKVKIRTTLQEKKQIFIEAYTQKRQEIDAKIAKREREKERRRQKAQEELAKKVERPLPPQFRFFYQEVVAPFVYVFRYHPFLSFGSIFVSVAILLSAWGIYDLAFKDLPSITEINERQQILTTKILDRHGRLLYSIYKDENRTLIPLSQVPVHMQHATIAIEDKEFYTHHGFSLRGMIRALNSNLRGEHIQGGSTITQQLVKNTLLSPERTYKRKIREILLAFMMESTYTKEEILEMYFNEVPFGGSTYGIEEAAQRYFGKSARQLTLAESAFLAGLPAAPSLYSPFGATPEYAYVRQREVLRRMVEDKYISEEDAQKARTETLIFRQDTTDIKAPHFVMYVRNLLAQQYGEDVVSQGGLEVRTTLDLDDQEETQKIVTEEVNKLTRYRISNGAALVTNPQTGEIIAMVGSKNYFDFQNDGQVNVTLRARQPGSSIKPLTYAIAMEQGKISPSSVINDEPVKFDIPGSAPYIPKNYDGKFHGHVTVRESLGSSYNIPAVKTLASIGISTMIDKGEQMGISTWGDRKRFGLSLTLGGGEVLMADLSQVYGTFATYGNTVKLNPILEVKNAQGDILYENTCAKDKTNCPSTRTLDAKVAYQITNILSDNNARTPAFGPRSVLVIPNQQVAVKTGTTNSMRDNWTIGYTKDRVVAVWVGNNDNTPMSYVASGITGASPIWNKIIRTQLSETEPHRFDTPEGLIKVRICVRTGTLPCTGCPYVREELFTPGTEPKQACNPAQFKPKTPNPSASPSPQILDGINTSR